MNTWKKMLGVAVVTAAPFAASAAEISGNVTMATDYVFRGYSQTSEKGAIQGGFDVDFGNGFYVGTWASNVDFGSEVTTEMDFYGGYAFDVAEGVGLDLGVVHFMYPGDEAALNYQEYIASVSVSDFSFGLVYSPDYFGDGNGDATVINLDYSMSVAEDVSLDFHVGQTTTDEDGLVDDDDSYIDYMIGANYDVADVTLTLAYYGTDVDNDAAADGDADDRFVFSISKSL
ncbi:TorF family putative porin [Spongiibacter marinus]|uniref:TorF family putative porin n=1 Tax=Spongiibacter marinus TaxID=354246 RepID=UPI000425C621|nr:TorF family putative porin [Spongiibacter marinus]